MRIDDLIAMFIPPAPLGASSGRRVGLQAIDTGGSDSSPGRRGGFAAAPVGRGAPAPNAPAQQAASGDRADLISLLASRTGVGRAPQMTESAQPADPFANGASIVDGYVRQRAILAYRFPQQSPFGPQIDLTFDVEVAYRVIDIVPAGSLVDRSA